jgi:hypothetical protein
MNPNDDPLRLPPPGANGNPPMNHALAVLYGLSLALTAPDKARELKAANLTVDLYHQSELTEEDLSILKAAAIVIADYGVE